MSSNQETIPQQVIHTDTSNLHWAPQQNEAIRCAVRWFERRTRGDAVPQVHRIFGYAGTGKTTIAKEIARLCGGMHNVRFGSYTGKASLVLQSKGCYGAATIHSMIYETEVDDDGVPHWFLSNGSMIRNAKLIIIDECSMVNQEIGSDLLSFGVPVLVLGDPAQLPPPKGAGFFTNASPDSMLTDIHRQGKENPIIWMATQVRQENYLQRGTYGDSVVSNEVDINLVDQYDQVLCGKNDTRSILNAQIRAHMGFTSEYPMTGDRLIGLKNDKKLGIYNGGMFEVKNEYTDVPNRLFWKGRLINLDSEAREVVDVKVARQYLSKNGPQITDWRWLNGSQQFDYGYAITAHKSQGSQWDRVMVFDESGVFGEERFRWLYTAITRAAHSVRIVA